MQKNNNKELKKLVKRRVKKGISIIQIQVLTGWTEQFVKDLESNTVQYTTQDIKLYKEAISSKE